MPVNKRNVSRISPPNNRHEDSNTAQTTTLVVLPKHAHVPHIPSEGELSFALFMFFFNIISMGLQYVHLYKTTWWLPYSHHQYAINFRLINFKLVGYLVAMVFLPFLFSLFKQVRAIENRCLLSVSLSFFTAISLVWAAFFCWMSYFVYHQTSLLYCILLVYPCITYALVFYGHLPSKLWQICKDRSSSLGSSLISSSSSSSSSSFTASASAAGPAAGGTGPGSNSGSPHCSPAHRQAQAPMHNCTQDPEKVREEAEALKLDFNKRMKEILFSTLFSSFHASLVPLLFVQIEAANCDENCWNTVYLEPVFCGVHVLFTVASAFLFYTQHHLPPHCVDNLHRCALHLGSWVRVEGRGSAHVPYIPWSELQMWPEGALVKHVRGLFRAEGVNNAAEPGNAMHARFSCLFYNPMRLPDLLQYSIASLLLVQFLLLLQCYEWYKILSCAIMMLFNLVSLYKLTRNRLVFKRCYSAAAAGAANGAAAAAEHKHYYHHHHD